jgi:hypothetical protein
LLIERFTLLSFPVAVRVIAFILPISFVSFALARIYKEQAPFLYNHYSIVSAVLGITTVILIFSMLKSSFRRLRNLIKNR